MEKIGTALQSTASVEEKEKGFLLSLDVTDCDLGYSGMYQIGINLKRSRLEELHASENNCGDLAAIQFADSLATSTCRIRVLNLSLNHLSDKTAHNLANAISRNK